MEPLNTPSPITDIGEVRRIITEARKLGEIPNLRGLNFAGQNFRVRRNQENIIEGKTFSNHFF